MTNPPIVPVLEALNPAFSGLRTWGGWTPVRCAFHGDRHASASYNPDEGVYKCHACGIAGDAYEIVKLVEGVSFPDAKRRVEEITGVSGGTVRSQPGTGQSRSKLLGKPGDQSSRRKMLQARGRGRRLSSPR